MSTVTGAYLDAQRRAQRLTRSQLAAACGYTNLSQGAQRIVQLERDGIVAAGLLEKMVAALGADVQHVQALLTEDRRRFEDDWNRWASESVAPKLRWRVLPAIWVGEALPTGLSKEAATAHARARAIERQVVYVVIWNRRTEVWCYPDGRIHEAIMNIGEVAGPSTRLRGRGGKSGFVFG